MNRRRKSCYRPYEGKRWPLWRKAVLALLLAGRWLSAPYSAR